MQSLPMSMPLACALILLLFLLAPAEGSFLRATESVKREAVESSLLAELAGNFQSNSTKQRIDSLKSALEPLYSSMPKQAEGSLSHAVVRYVLHRFFAQSHGWHVRGLEPDGDARNKSSAADLQEWVPGFLQNFLEELNGVQGLSLKELAILTATLEDLIHKEAEERLKQAYMALQQPLSTSMVKSEVQKMLEVYMMVYLLNGNYSSSDVAETESELEFFASKSKSWPEIQEWLQGLLTGSGAEKREFDFEQVLGLVHETAERYGDLNDRECKSLKSELLSIESAKAGRVRLLEFYKHGLKGVWDFNEKIDYLRAIGALDESDPRHPHVIVPNYVGSRPNCLEISDFYVQCCRNGCESLMASLEQEVGGPMANPGDIASAVIQLASDTVTAPWTMTDALLQRLRSIADVNGGHVPVHGRLFAQWMHHAYPRECPYPHIAGTTSPQTPDEWMQETGHATSSLSEEEMLEQVSSDTCAFKPGVMEPSPECATLHNTDLPWNEVEELLHPASNPESMLAAELAVRESPVTSRISNAAELVWAAIRAVAIFAMLGILAAGMLWIRSPRPTQDMSDCSKSFV